jgi:multidrug transporter EmrE-like cation transporter
MVFFGDPVGTLRLLSFGLILVGVIGLRLGG